MMRTTLDLDDRLLAIARARARAQGVSLGRAVSDLAMQGVEASTRVGDEIESSLGFPILAGVPGHVITSEMVADVLDED